MQERPIYFKDAIALNSSILNRPHIAGSVYGKIQNKDAYVVSLRGAAMDLNILIKTFGYPNRHLLLEWGNYTGDEYEFIVSGKDLIRVER